MIKQAVILAGGLGTRLRPLTDNIPKPMVLVNGRPFLEHLIELLIDNGIKEIVLCVGYLHEKIIDHFKDGSAFGVKIVYSIGPVDFETGKRLKLAENLLDKRFLLLYCDNYWPLQLETLIEVYERCKTLALMTVYSNKKGITKNNVSVENNIVKRYDKSRKSDGIGVDIGFFIFDRSVMGMIDDDNVSFEEKVFPILVEKRQFSAFITDHRYYSISTIERLREVEEFLKSKKIVFLDSDGVINKKPP
ncbi:MAG: sugar phosphate nucleotidyltransferase, partial [Nitrospinota bacterium]